MKSFDDSKVEKKKKIGEGSWRELSYKTDPRPSYRPMYKGNEITRANIAETTRGSSGPKYICITVGGSISYAHR